MTSLGQNITRFIREQQLSLPKLAAKAGMDKGNLYRIIQEGRGYSADSLGRIAQALGVTLGALFAEEPNVVAVASGMRRIPILDAVHAGQFSGVNPVFRDEEMQEYLMTSGDYSNKAFAMRVAGDSMVPDFQPGDFVIVDPEGSPKPGRFVVAINGGGEATLKKYASRGITPEGHEIFELIPSNPLYASLRSDQHPLRIIGTARERIQKLP